MHNLNIYFQDKKGPILMILWFALYMGKQIMPRVIVCYCSHCLWGFSLASLFCFAVHCAPFCFAIIWRGKRVALILLSSECRVSVMVL